MDDRSRLVGQHDVGACAALTLSHGNHGWIPNRFTTTTDPLTTASFALTGVRVVGQFDGLHKRNGYDIPPDPSSPEPPPALCHDLDVRSAVHGLGWPLSLSIERGAAVMARLGVRTVVTDAATTLALAQDHDSWLISHHSRGPRRPWAGELADRNEGYPLMSIDPRLLEWGKTTVMTLEPPLTRVEWGFGLRWVLATTVGWVVGFGICEALKAFLESLSADGAVIGISVGIMQWLALKRRINRAGWWILASILGFAVGKAVGDNIAQAVSGGCGPWPERRGNRSFAWHRPMVCPASPRCPGTMVGVG